MLQLIAAADSVDPGGAGHLPIHDGENFHLIRAFDFGLKVFALLRGGEGVLLRVSQQVIRFRMGQDEIVQCGLAVGRGATAQTAGRAVFQLDDLVVGHGNLLETGVKRAHSPICSL